MPHFGNDTQVLKANEQLQLRQMKEIEEIKTQYEVRHDHPLNFVERARAKNEVEMEMQQKLNIKNRSAGKRKR